MNPRIKTEIKLAQSGLRMGRSIDNDGRKVTAREQHD
jgi:hypothetical protein